MRQRFTLPAVGVLIAACAIIRCATDDTVAGVTDSPNNRTAIVAFSVTCDSTPCPTESFLKRKEIIRANESNEGPLSVFVRVRESSHIPGLVDGEAIDTVTDRRAGIAIALQREKTYTIEILDDIGYGALVADLHIPSDRDSIDLGVLQLRDNGSVKILCRDEHIDKSTMISAAIRGLSRHTEAPAGEPLYFRNLPEGDYDIRIGSNREIFTGARIKKVRIEGGATVTEAGVTLPVDYRRDSIAVAAFLDSQEVVVENWDALVHVRDFRIRTLRLKYMPLGNVHRSLGALAFLRGLDLTGSSVGSLPLSIGEIPHLEAIDLDSVALDSLPTAMMKCASLRHLHLNHTQLRKYPEWLGTLPKLENVFIADNGYKRIPDEIFAVATLRILDAKRNLIDSLPAEIGNLPMLEILDVRENNLTFIAPDIGACKQLKTIWAYRNSLPSIPDSITNLENLSRLHLEGNRLTALPESIGRLKSLKNLNVGYNSLVSLPSSIIRCTALVSLEVKRNSICLLPREIEQFIVEYEGEKWMENQNGCD